MSRVNQEGNSRNLGLFSRIYFQKRGNPGNIFSLVSPYSNYSSFDWRVIIRYITQLMTEPAFLTERFQYNKRNSYCSTHYA